MEIKIAESYINRLLKKYDLKCSVIWTKAVGYLGEFISDDNQIRMSKPYTLICEKSIVYDVIKHEIAHAIDFKRRKKTYHDKIWKEIAKKIKCSATVVYHQPKKNLKKIWKYYYFCMGKKCIYSEYASRLKTNIRCPVCNRILYVETNNTIKI